MRGLYIHIPFCVKKCSYCDFYSLPAHTDTIESYVQAVLQEAHAYSPSFVRPKVPCISTGRIEGELFPHLNPSQSPFTKGRSPSVSFQTLYIGGGTPSLLGPKNLTTLITSLPCHSERSEESSSPHRHCERSEAISERGGIPNPSMLVSSPIERERKLSLLVSPLAPCGRRPQPEVPEARRETESERGANQTVNPLCSSPLEGEDSGEGFPLSKNKNSLIESTIEVNPESATPEFLQTVKNLGFTRLSFGVQSLNDNELQSVGRIHTAAQAIKAIKLAQKINFQSISADLIIGLPGQSWTSLRNSLSTLVGMGIQHLSVYCLSLEAGTPMANNPPPDLPTDEMQARLFEETRNYLKTCGFAHYEISNFALPGYECLHNLNYWRGGEYLGLGPAAASHLNGKRFKNRANLDAYLQNPTGQIEDIEELNPKNKAAEEAMLRLRLLEEGLNLVELTAKFGPANTVDIIRRLDKMVQEGLLLQTGSACRLEPSRILTSNPIFARVLGD